MGTEESQGLQTRRDVLSRGSVIWYAVIVFCTTGCFINFSPEISQTFDECLTHSSNLNHQITGLYMPARRTLSDNNMHINFGCFETKIWYPTKTLRLMAWKKYGPSARPPKDKNIGRILRRKRYDHPNVGEGEGLDK